MYNNEKQFSISETVHRNLENVQFPHFRNHKSLVGWTGMNYPRTLVNPAFQTKPKSRDFQQKTIYDKSKFDDDQTKIYDDISQLEFIHQMRPQSGASSAVVFKKPLTNFLETSTAIREEKVGVPPVGFKSSLLTLTTTKTQSRKEIIQQTNRKIQDISIIRPLSCEMGTLKYDQNFKRPIRQIGDVSYVPDYESEDVRHMKKLPNNVLTEQNLLEILNPTLKEINLLNHTWIKNDLLNKIGYFAPKIQYLGVSGTEIIDEVLIQLAITCHHLKGIDISKCINLTERGVKGFLQHCINIRRFFCSHNEKSITDFSIEPLKKCNYLQEIDLSFDNKVTDMGLSFLLFSECQLKVLKISSVPLIAGKTLTSLINNSKLQLEEIDISLLKQSDVGRDLLLKLGNCARLRSINCAGCVNISDDGISFLAQGDDSNSKPNGFDQLEILKLSGTGVGDISLNKLLSLTVKLRVLELNNCERLTDYVLQSVNKYCPKLQVLSINMTPNITDLAIDEYKKEKENSQVSLIRHYVKLTDLKDDGLRMPYPNIHSKKQKPKQKKKK